MICLYCTDPIADSATADEIKYSWHGKCIKKFFGTNRFPEIDVSKEALMQLVLCSIEKGYTVPGVQKKLSLYITKEDNNPRLTMLNHPTGFILKLQTEEYAHLPEAEFLVMQMASATGIRTVPFALIKMPSQDNSFAYITRRVDRIPNKSKQVEMLAMEDFCQLDGRLTQDKYRGSYERCAKLISKYSIRPGLDLSELFLRIVFSFVTGNSDMHLKNISLVETSGGSLRYVLSDAYDMIPVSLVLPEDTEQLALTINGRKSRIQRKDFFVFAETTGIPKKSAEKMIQKIVSMEEKYILMCRNSFITKNMKENVEGLIRSRSRVLDAR